MRHLKSLRFTVLGLMLGVSGWSQSNADGLPAASPDRTHQRRKPGAGRDIGSGAADIGTGVAKGGAAAAKGVGWGAVDLVTLHPIDAGISVGTGAVTAGKDVAVGTVKGTGRIARGIGKGVKKLF